MKKTLIRGRLLVWNAAAEPRPDAALLVHDGAITAVGEDALRLADGATRRLDFPGAGDRPRPDRQPRASDVER